jgi:WD40 repeat protein
MNENKLSKHPLFDPASMYSRMRNSVRPEYKMRGYFHWLKARAIRLGIPLPKREEERQRKLHYLACSIAGVNAVRALAVLPDGRLASGSYDSTVRIWDLHKNESLTLQGHEREVRALAVLPDGRLASGSDDGTVRVWDLHKNETVTFWGQELGVSALVVLPDGRLAAGSRDGTVCVWDLHKNERRVLQGHTGEVLALAVLPDGRLATGSRDGTVCVWDLYKNESPLTLQGHSEGVNALAVLPDGRLVSSSAGGMVRVWNLHKNESLSFWGEEWRVSALAVLPDGRLVSGGRDGTVRVWDLHKNESLTLQGHKDCVLALADIKHRAATALEERQQEDHYLLDRIRQSHRAALALQELLQGYEDCGLAMAVLPDGRLAAGSRDGTVCVWDLPSGASRIVGDHGPDFRVTDAVEVRGACLLLGSRQFPEKLLVGSLVLVCEADGTRTVGMRVEHYSVHMMSLGQPISCRAFLIEPEVLARLQEVVRKAFEVDSDKALIHAFEAETIASNMDIARLLSAIPDLDGEVRNHEICFRRLPVAGEFDAFPPRQGPLTVVLVFDDPPVSEPTKDARQQGEVVGSRTRRRKKAEKGEKRTRRGKGSGEMPEK